MGKITSEITSSVGGLHAVLSTVLHWCLLPGIVVHELSHVVACRALGVEVREAALFERPRKLTSPKLRAGAVAHEGSTSLWQSALVSLAPLVGNTSCAILVFALTRRLLQGPTLITTGTNQQILTVGGLWIGVAVAVTGFPSEPDFRNIGRYCGRFSWLDTKGMVSLLDHTRTLLAMAYTLLLVFGGIFGVERGLRLMVTEYVAVPAGFLLAFVWAVIRSRSERLSMPPTGVERRIERLSRQVESGNRVDGDDMRFLIDQLTNPDSVTRERATETLGTVAARQPDQFAPYTDELLTLAETATIPVVQRALLRTLTDVRDEVADYQRLGAVSVAALEADSARVRDAVPRLLVGIALDEPAVLDRSVSAMQAAIPRISPTERGNLVLALTLVETADVSASRDTDVARIPAADTNTTSTAVKEQLLRSLPADARETAAILIESLESTPEARPRTVTGFRKLGDAYPAAQPAIASLLVTYLDDTDPDTRSHVGMALRSFAEFAPTAVGPHRAALETGLTDTDRRVRRDITGTIGLLAERYPDVVEMYADECWSFLDGNGGEIRKTAAWALAAFAETSPSALESRTDQLVAQLVDPQDDVREFSMQALGAIAEVSPERVVPHADVLQHHLEDPAPDVRMWITVIFGRLVDSHPAAVAPASDALVGLLTTNDGVVKHNGLIILGGVSDAESASVEAGIDFLIDRLDSGEQAAGRALAALASYAPILLECRHPRLVATLGDGVPAAQTTVLDTTIAGVRDGRC